ncbi:Tn3 family transposase, partial [Streptomyces sp. SID685]|nr:Tn3 family transposase [Streptomyces sp. SID685]
MSAWWRTRSNSPIRRQYDQIVKYSTALRLGTAEAEQVLRRFTRGGPEHPHLPGDRGTRAAGADGIHLRLPAAPGHPERGEVAEAAYRRRPACLVPAVLDPREPLWPVRAGHELPPRPRCGRVPGARTPYWARANSRTGNRGGDRP